MRFRALHSLLLASLVFWTTGTALNLHELIEHGDAAIARAAADHSTDKSTKHHDPANHDDCPTCQLLAHLQVDRIAPPVALPTPLCNLTLCPHADWLPPVALPAGAISIRGPPGSVASLI